MPIVVNRWLSALLDVVFPPTCVNCHRVGSLFCPDCWADAVFPPPSPPQVEHITELVALARHDGAIREALHALKYENIREVAQPLGRQLAAKIQWTFDVIIPVPLHYARLQERGYNQANLLAQALSLSMNRPVSAQSLVRHKATTSQVGLGASDRQINVADAFRAIGVIPARVLLVDDVCTTGATLGAAALALQLGGAQTVYAATVSQAG